MKFHNLEICNINSLYEEQTINFDGELSQTPLFLIMGPTGSGKTTILDCICLVLFGTTPRQKGVSSTSEIADHIMSRGKGEASVTLEFSRRAEDGERLRYRAGWYCNRAYKKASGAMQTPRRSLDRWSEDAGDWESLTTSTTQKEYEPYFDEALADMALEDFLRSVLLAQGAFTAFLEANPDKKADILEKLTSTEAYMSIGGRAMHRWQEAKASVEEVENTMEGVTLLDDEEFETLKAERDNLAEKAEQKTAKRDELKRKLDWLTKLEELHARISKARKQLDVCQKTREEHDDDFERLALAKRAQPAAKLLDERDRLDDELTDLREDVAERREALEELRPRHKEAVAKVSAARKAHGRAKKERSDMAEALDEAKALYTKLETAKTAADEKRGAASDAKEKLEALEQELSDARDALDQIGEQRDAAADELEALSAYAGIGEDFAGLEADVSSLEASFKQVDEQTKTVEALQSERAEATEQLEDVEVKLDGEDESLEPLQVAVEKAREALEAELDGAEGAGERRRVLREEVAAASERQQATQKLAEEVAELVKARADYDARSEELDEVEAALGEANERVEALRESMEKAREDVQTRADVLDARQDAAKYVRARAKLDDGQSCPVCGSTEHPWAGQDDESDAVLEKLASAREALAEAEATLEERRTSFDEARQKSTKLEQQLESMSERAGEARVSVETREATVRSALDAVEVEASLEDLGALEDDVAGLVDEAKARRDEFEQSQEALEEAVEAHDDATKALEEAKSRGDDLREKKRSLDQSIESLNTQVEQARHKLAQLRASFDEDVAALQERFASVGVAVELDVEKRTEQVEAFEAALAEAAEQKKARKAKKDALEQLTTKMEKREASVENLAETQLPEQRDRHKKAAEAAEDAAETVSTLKSKTETVLDGDKPSEVETRLENAVEQAEAAVEDAEAKHDALKEKVTTLETELKEKEKRRKTLKEERDEVDKALTETLETLEIADVDTLRDARLDDEARAELDELVSEIREALAGAKATLENAEDELEAHDEARPDALDDDVEADDLAEQVAAVEKEKTLLDQTLGEKRGTIKSQEEARARHAKLGERLQERRVVLRRWEQIHDLIGRNQGAHFKRFAQALNLERIVHKANHHLEQLHDRYRLAVVKDGEGHPKLEFEVVDTHVANTARAISTLSGGETFLVSLALALALADFRQVKMPVETLLLDEGFGTLDQQSLDDAVCTLKTLHTREKRQVGVISHVERLQEEIQHRVVVRKLSGGRSRIELETP